MKLSGVSAFLVYNLLIHSILDVFVNLEINNNKSYLFSFLNLYAHDSLIIEHSMLDPFVQITKHNLKIQVIWRQIPKMSSIEEKIHQFGQKRDSEGLEDFVNEISLNEASDFTKLCVLKANPCHCCSC
jgi:hypothetical protein